MPIPEPKPYTYVRLIEDTERIKRFEIRVSIFVEYDEDPGRRAVTSLPSRTKALEIAKEIARARRIQCP